jgi:excisionase family DNA binding protein
MADDFDDGDVRLRDAVTVVNPRSWEAQVPALGQLLAASERLPEGMRVVPDASGRPPASTLTLANPGYWSQHLSELADALRSEDYDGSLWARSRVPASVGAMSEAPTRLTWTVEEAAAALGISRALAYDAVRRGDVPAIKVGRRILVPRSALKQLLESPESRSTTAE